MCSKTNCIPITILLKTFKCRRICYHSKSRTHTTRRPKQNSYFPCKQYSNLFCPCHCVCACKNGCGCVKDKGTTVFSRRVRTQRTHHQHTQIWLPSTACSIRAKDRERGRERDYCFIEMMPTWENTKDHKGAYTQSCTESL